MPIADTELLFALSSLDKKHEKTVRSLKIKGLKILDTALLEFQIVLKARGRSPKEIYLAIEALRNIFHSMGIKEICTINTKFFLLQAEIERKYKLSYFDSMIAASALSLDGIVVSDDTAFDRVPNLKRIPLGEVRY